jgi:hypothetical protein
MRQRPIVGWMWHAAAVLSALAIMLYIRQQAAEAGMGATPIPIVGPMAGLVMALPLLLYAMGQRHFVSAAETVMAADPRPPVLYLRSFAAEQRISTDERALARLLGSVGPFVAVANPAERLPPLGASRFYLPGPDWQGFVGGLVRQARLVFVLAGSSAGLAWELQLCRQVLDPSQLVVLVPKDEKAYAAFREMARSAGLDLPAFPRPPEWRIPGRVLALVSFEAGWRPSLVVRHYAIFDAVTPLAETTASLRFELRDLLEPRGIVLGPSEDTVGQAMRRHWRLGLIGALVFVAWKGITAFWVVSSP